MRLYKSRMYWLEEDIKEAGEKGEIDLNRVNMGLDMVETLRKGDICDGCFRLPRGAVSRAIINELKNPKVGKEIVREIYGRFGGEPRWYSWEELRDDMGVGVSNQ